MASAVPVVVPRMKLGSQGLEVSAQGLGCMGMSCAYGERKPDAEMIALLHHAVATGVTLLDTSDVYGPHTNEILIGKALQGGVRHKVELATKFWRHPVSRRQLGGPRGPGMGEIKKLVQEGKVKYVGLSEVSASTIRRAHAVHPITAVELEWSLWSRDVEEDIIPTCRDLGIGIVAYCPLGRGFLSSGPIQVDTLPEDDFRKYLPRFQSVNMEKNAAIFEHVSEMAAKKGCTPSQLALAWVHHQGNDVCPIPGTTKLVNFNQNVRALSVKLTPEEMAELESCAAMDNVQGDRYHTQLNTWNWKDSQTPPLSSWKAT
ncbi:hypothetical protein ACQ4PT_060545 [Festuca glaucescens]